MTMLRPDLRGALTIALLACALCACGADNSEDIDPDAGGNTDGGGDEPCVDDGDCPEGTACDAGTCVLVEGPPIETDITGAWWMLRHRFVGAPEFTPPDVPAVSFEQTGSTFVQRFDDDPGFEIPGSIEGGTVYVQTDGSFRAELRFSAGDYGTGTFEQDGFAFDMVMMRRAPAAFDVAGDWVIEGTDVPVRIDVQGDVFTVDLDGTAFTGRVAGSRALAVAATSGAGDESMQVEIANETSITALVTSRVAGTDQLSQRAIALVPPGDPVVGDGTPPTVTRIVPESNLGTAWSNAPVRITFSEPVDPATVTARSVLVRPLQPVDGVTYGDGEGLDGTFEVDGNQATFVPARGALEAYRTEYEVTFTDAITDLAGTPLTPPARAHRFRTLILQEGATYQIVYAADGRLLAALDGGSGTLDTVGLAPAGTSGRATEWTVTWWRDAMFVLQSEAFDALTLVEGGVADGHATFGDYGGTVFSGQVWAPIALDERSAGPGESPTTWRLTTEFQGPDINLGIYEGDGPVQRVGLHDNADLDTAWFFRQVDVTPAGPCAADADCGGYICWPPVGACYASCLSDEICADGFVCVDQACVSP